jgi:hypothetical protein
VLTGDQTPSGHAYTSSVLHGNGADTDTAGDGAGWWICVGGGSASLLWGFKSVEGLEPNAYTHALVIDFDLVG